MSSGSARKFEDLSGLTHVNGVGGALRAVRNRTVARALHGPADVDEVRAVADLCGRRSTVVGYQDSTDAGVRDKRAVRRGYNNGDNSDDDESGDHGHDDDDDVHTGIVHASG